MGVKIKYAVAKPAPAPEPVEAPATVALNNVGPVEVVVSHDPVPPKTPWPFVPLENPKIAEAAMVLAQASKETVDAVLGFANAMQTIKAAHEAEPEDPPPWESPDGYTIVDALKEFSLNKPAGKELWLYAKNGMACYRVVSYNVDDKRCQLVAQNGMKLKPVIGEREIPLYRPYWKLCK